MTYRRNDLILRFLKKKKIMYIYMLKFFNFIFIIIYFKIITYDKQISKIRNKLFNKRIKYKGNELILSFLKKKKIMYIYMLKFFHFIFIIIYFKSITYDEQISKIKDKKKF